ncbi:MAG: hypothetical protein AAB646_02290 [Patescibacteria group bacterium]
MRRHIYFIIIIFVTGALASVSLGAAYSLVVELKYQVSSGTILSNSLLLAEDEHATNLFQPEDGFSLKLFSKKGEELYSTRFHVPMQIGNAPPPKSEWFDPKTGEQIHIPTKKELLEIGDFPVQEELIFSISIPYYLESSLIKIYDPQDKVILTIDVPQSDRLIQDMIERQGKEEPLLVSDISAILVPAFLALLIVASLWYAIHRKRRLNGANMLK